MHTNTCSTWKKFRPNSWISYNQKKKKKAWCHAVENRSVKKWLILAKEIKLNMKRLWQGTRHKKEMWEINIFFALKPADGQSEVKDGSASQDQHR